jgi:decaprenyl-phosphate phosphoribosyltransferase
VGWQLAGVVASYLLLAGLYTVWFRQVAIIDLVAVACCYLTRAAAGAVAVAIPMSRWYLVVLSLGALLLVTGKREAELALGATQQRARATLQIYTPRYLTLVRATVSGALIVVYALWALSQRDGAMLVLYGASIVPFVVTVLQINLLIETGAGEEPDRLILRDRPLQLSVGGLLVALAAGTYFT